MFKKALMEYMGGERENFKNTIYLGRISKEQRNMLFDDFKEKSLLLILNKANGYIFTLWRRVAEKKL